MPFKETWSEEQIALLRERYSECGSNIPELLKDFTRQQIVAKANNIGVNGLRKRYKLQLLGKTLSCGDALRTVGLTSRVFHNAMEALGKSPQETFDYILNNFYVHENGQWLRTANKVTLSETNYIHRDGKCWGFQMYKDRYGLNASRELYNYYHGKFGFSADDTVAWIEGTAQERKDIKARYAKVPRGEGVYSSWEDEVIISNDQLTCEGLSELLPGRSVDSVYARCRMLGVTRQHSKAKTPSGISGQNKDIHRMMFAYRGTDNKEYYYCLCSVCSKVSIQNLECLADFQHGDVCSRLQIPRDFVPGYIFSMLSLPKDGDKMDETATSLM